MNPGRGLASYRLEGADRGGPWCVKRGDDLDDLLRRRDELREEAVRTGRSKRVVYFVTDADDAERGWAEWCGECGNQGVFGGSECPTCIERVARQAKGSPDA